MTRRSFFSKFATVAGALLAAPKLLKAAPAVAGLDPAYSGYDRTYIWHPHTWRHLGKPEMLETVEFDGEVFRLSPHPLRFEFDENLNPDKETINAHFREIESAWESVKQA